ncbi:hypothetical protein GUH75_06025, partial [Xanthomonas citri pv. citri]|nr:hypothetical protein [Xanthomonas citri pv. citri]
MKTLAVASVATAFPGANTAMAA